MTIPESIKKFITWILCIDGAYQEYKSLPIKFENILETWDFKFVNFAGSRRFILFCVRQDLWNLIQQFANEFDYIKGRFNNSDIYLDYRKWEDIFFASSIKYC
ncbi:hypothetical protein [Nostoc sp. LEGE 12450]|uniref:hypothetical protein n=1 Tax=Nostoc sp. LEGE 12450 TaxID=1828643 RepID=UPI00187EB4CD|nr:hypothetical protein [Nostoc sp. LEGE 12450]MBE8985916.1 hypothetical protein [Nostoc sp. LEGE 12450]